MSNNISKVLIYVKSCPVFSQFLHTISPKLADLVIIPILDSEHHTASACVCVCHNPLNLLRKENRKERSLTYNSQMK